MKNESIERTIVENIKGWIYFQGDTTLHYYIGNRALCGGFYSDPSQIEIPEVPPGKLICADCFFKSTLFRGIVKISNGLEDTFNFFSSQEEARKPTLDVSSLGLDGDVIEAFSTLGQDQPDQGSLDLETPVDVDTPAETPPADDEATVEAPADDGEVGTLTTEKPPSRKRRGRSKDEG